jgi:hypothetical protein
VYYYISSYTNGKTVFNDGVVDTVESAGHELMWRTRGTNFLRDQAEAFKDLRVSLKEQNFLRILHIKYDIKDVLQTWVQTVR